HSRLRAGLTAVLGLSLLGLVPAMPAVAQPPDHANRDRPGPPLHAKEGFLQSTLARMTLEEKVGQLFFTWAYGQHAHDTTHAAVNQANYGVDTPAEVVSKFHLGGVLYFVWADNTNNPAQINELSNTLQEVAVAEPSGIPLILTIDQET